MPSKKRQLTVVLPSTPVQPVAPVAVKRNHFAIVLDRSSSMGSLRHGAVNSVNATIEAIRAADKLYNQESTVSLYTFGSDIRHESSFMPVGMCKLMSTEAYQPYGNTALFDGVGQAIVDFEAHRSAHPGEDTSYVVLVTTDGEENCSRNYREGGSAGWEKERLPSLVERMRVVQATDLYTIAFQLPPGRGRWFANSYGVPLGNVREWEQTDAGIREVGETTTRGVMSFAQSRSVGLKSVSSYYVQTDMSKVTKADLSKLKDLSNQFKVWTVDKEKELRDFVQEHGKQYRTGCAYYQLTKTEKKVQPGKQVLVMEKGSKAVYGGQEARTLIGLPVGVDAKVEPGNHANYDIFIQSTSVNRHVVRGTKVLFDTTLSVDLPPTWDHSVRDAAKAAPPTPGVKF